MKRIGIADTMFAQVDMGKIARIHLESDSPSGLEVISVTVPGFKDLAVASKKLIEEQKCDIVLAMGWAGNTDLDARSARIASMGLMQAQLATNTHILEVFIHSEEAPNDAERLFEITNGRVIGHVENALNMLFDREILSSFAGRGRRQGGPHVGSLKGPT